MAAKEVRFSADARVDLVKYEGFRTSFFLADGFQGKHDSRKFAARGDFAQRLEVFTGVRADHELHVIEAAVPRLFGVFPGQAGRLDLDLEAGLFHAEQGDFRFDLFFQIPGGIPSESRESAGSGDVSCQGLFDVRFHAGKLVLDPDQVLVLLLDLPQIKMNVLDLSSVFSLQAFNQAEPLFNLLQFFRRDILLILVFDQNIRKILKDNGQGIQGIV